MKTSIKILLVMAIFISGCTESTKSTVEYGDCSISVNGIQFSKSLNNGEKLTGQKSENKLEFNSGEKSDFFNEPNGKDKYSNAPMLLTQVNNNEPFTFITKVSPEFSETYDAGALYLFVNNDKWTKFAFEMDERKLTRIVTVRTNGTSDDNNHDAIVAKSVFLKISSNAESVGFYYSTDSINWQLVRVYKNDFPAATYIGISSQSPLGSGIKTTFENLSLTNVAIKDFRKGI
nr:DUF1349 domain-containing protein [uncultured Draconibacterium sp.]